MQITTIQSKTIIAKRAVEANGFISKAVGLIGRKDMSSLDALIIRKCNNVHMFGMRFSIDILFCNSSNLIIDFQERLKPWRVSKRVKAASFVIELPSGTINRLDIHIGDQLSIC